MNHVRHHCHYLYSIVSIVLYSNSNLVLQACMLIISNTFYTRIAKPAYEKNYEFYNYCQKKYFLAPLEPIEY
jgi:hypothetical protein